MVLVLQKKLSSRKEKKVKKVLSVVMLCSLMMFAVPSSATVILSNSPTTVDSFLDETPLFVSSYSSTFDFAPTTSPYDGIVTSAAFKNTEGTKYGYIYGINVLRQSSDEVSGLAVDFWQLVGNYSFYITDDEGSVAPGGATLSNSEVARFSFIPETLLPGDTSYWFGAYSTLPPGLRTANLFDAGGEASPDVLAPVPEPGTIILLGSGLVGLAGWGRKKFRK